MCGKSKSLAEFYPRHIRCKQCCNEASLAYQQCRKQKGQCSKCTNQVADGRTKCSECLQKVRQLAADRKANGHCTICGKDSLPGRVYCQVCSKRQNKNNVRKKEIAKQTPCSCGANKNLFLKRCDLCQQNANLESRRASSKRRREQFIKSGLCAECGKYLPKDNNLICERCERKSRIRDNERLHVALNGKCRICGDTALPKLPRCRACELRFQDRTTNGQYRRYVGPCEVCGYSVIAVIQVHHIDGNRKNNQPSNLIPLCPTHHVEVERGVIPCPPSPYDSIRQQYTFWEALYMTVVRE